MPPRSAAGQRYNVEGDEFPAEALMPTAGLKAGLRVLLRCPSHIAHLKCNDGDRCLRAHFVPLLAAGPYGQKPKRTSAGAFSWSEGLRVGIRTGLASGNSRRACLSGAKCERGSRCTFLHRAAPQTSVKTAAFKELSALQTRRGGANATSLPSGRGAAAAPPAPGGRVKMSTDRPLGTKARSGENPWHRPTEQKAILRTMSSPEGEIHKLFAHTPAVDRREAIAAAAELTASPSEAQEAVQRLLRSRKLVEWRFTHLLHKGKFVGLPPDQVQLHPAVLRAAGDLLRRLQRHGTVVLSAADVGTPDAGAVILDAALAQLCGDSGAATVVSASANEVTVRLASIETPPPPTVSSPTGAPKPRSFRKAAHADPMMTGTAEPLAALGPVVAALATPGGEGWGDAVAALKGRSLEDPRTADLLALVLGQLYETIVPGALDKSAAQVAVARLRDDGLLSSAHVWFAARRCSEGGGVRRMGREGLAHALGGALCAGLQLGAFQPDMMAIAALVGAAPGSSEVLKNGFQGLARNVESVDASVAAWAAKRLETATKGNPLQLALADQALAADLRLAMQAIVAIPDGGMACDVALLRVEDAAQRASFLADQLPGARFTAADPPVRPAVVRREQFIDVLADEAAGVDFTQLLPPVFVGQETQVGPADAGDDQRVRFKVCSIDQYRLVLCPVEQRGGAMVSWIPERTTLAVRLVYNPWHINSLVKHRCAEPAGRFLAQLMTDALRPAGNSMLRVHPGELSSLLDEIQMRFVQQVLCRPRLALLIGPAGTGKTQTLTATIEAIFRSGAGRVLACATNVGAANHLAHVLLACGVPLLRSFTASSAPIDVRDSADADLLSYGPGIRNTLTGEVVTKLDQINEHCAFVPVSPEQLHQAPVVVATTAHTHWMRGAFSFIFVDEAPQSVEAETLIPIVTQQEEATIVLAGDTQQLPPALVSVAAANEGLGDSLLHRRALRIATLKSVSRVTLRRCYRCHPAILDIFSRRFYAGQRETGGLQPGRPSHEFMLPNCPFIRPDLPVFMTHVDAPAAPVATGDAPPPPVHRNESEAMVAADLATRLVLANPEQDPADLAGDIGIIVPFPAQALAVKYYLSQKVATGVLRRDVAISFRVGTVEQFQGLSLFATIISLTTAVAAPGAGPGSRSFIGAGSRGRSTVAMSRAEAFMAVVGDAQALLKLPDDDPWRTLVTELVNANAVISVADLSAWPVAPMPLTV